MKATCPYCGYEENVADDNYGKTVECPCGKSFVVGQVQVPETAFIDDVATVRCPFCESDNSMPKEAIGQDVRCGKCNGKFRVGVKNERDSPIRSTTGVGNGKISARTHPESGQTFFGQDSNLRSNQTRERTSPGAEHYGRERNCQTRKCACEYLNLDAARIASSILLWVSNIACVVWACISVSTIARYKQTIGLFDALICWGLPLLTAASVYVSLSMVIAVLEIAKNLRQVCNGVSQFQQ